MVGSVHKNGNQGWRLILRINGKSQYGPTRSEKDGADADKEYVNKGKSPESPAGRLAILKRAAATGKVYVVPEDGDGVTVHAELHHAGKACAKHAGLSKAYKHTKKNAKNARRGEFPHGMRPRKPEKCSQRVPKASEIMIS
eukprot:12427571-Karenia_brevis.AAC.1